MKRSVTVLKSLSRYVFAGLLGLTMLSSCKKDDENDVGETAAKVALINASTDAGAANLYVDGVLRTTGSVSFGAASGFAGTFVGDQDIEVKSASGQATLVSSNAQLDALSYNTFVLIGQSSSLGLITVSDPGTAPAAGKARIRFVNASPNSASTSLSSGSTVLVNAVAYRGVSSASEVDAGSYTFSVSSGNVRSTAGAVTLESGKSYVVYARGLIGSSGNSAFSVGISGN